MTILKVFDNVIGFYLQRAHFQYHRRLKVFWNKGFSCVQCGLEGNKIIKSKDKCGNVHYDLYHWTPGKRILMTVDHIIPKSLGGGNQLENLQPMCCKCNTAKGNKIYLPIQVNCELALTN